MSKQLQKLNYSPEEVEISVVGSSTPTTGSLTITQIKTLLASDQNYIKYTINTTTSEYLYFSNFTNNTAFYGADLYNATTSVYYRHLIKISYSSDLSSATWNYYNIPIITGSSSDLQEKLVSGTNIKTINSNSLLGSGNLAISEFPERSEVDAALSQIAGLNSNGLPDVGKVSVANINSGSANSGQVPVADGNGGVAWGNKQDTLTASSINDGTIAKAIGFDSSNNLVKGTVGGGYKHTYDLVVEQTPFDDTFGHGAGHTRFHYIFKTNASINDIETGILTTVNNSLGSSFSNFSTLLIDMKNAGITELQILSAYLRILDIAYFPRNAGISNSGFTFLNFYLEIPEGEGYSNILATYRNHLETDVSPSPITAIIYGETYANNTYIHGIIDLYDELKNNVQTAYFHFGNLTIYEI